MELHFVTPDPEEQKNLMDKAALSAHEYHERLMRLFTELSPEDLVTVRDLIISTLNETSFGVMRLGTINTILHLVHKRCVGCGEDHLAEQQAELERKKREEEAMNKADTLRIEREAVMKEYNIKEKDDGTLVCGGCGIGIPSIQDRMLRKPGDDGCSGCQQKAAWG